MGETGGTVGGPVLRTARLVLIPVRAPDVAELLRHWNNVEVGRHLWDGTPIPRPTVEELVAASERDFREVGYGIWAVRRTGAAPIVGTCGLRQRSGQAELLFSLEPAWRSRGMATEAARAVLARALVVGGVVAFTERGNEGSQRVLARIGLTPCGFDDEPWVRWRLGHAAGTTGSPG